MKMKLFFLLNLLLIIFVPFVKSNAQIMLPNGNIIYDSIQIIFSEKCGTQNAPGYVLQNNKQFTPNINDIARLNKSLPVALKLIDEYIGKLNISRNYIVIKQLVPNLGDYYRQYVGYETRHGRKVIWINFFCNEFEDWYNQIEFVFGGGACYITLKYDIAADYFFDFSVNDPSFISGRKSKRLLRKVQRFK